METDQKKGSYLTRALAVIEKAALAERPLTPTEINNELQIPKATIHRLCQFLEDEQFLQKSLEGKRLIPRLNRFYFFKIVPLIGKWMMPLLEEC